MAIKVDPRLAGTIAFAVLCIAFAGMSYWVVSSAASNQQEVAEAQESPAPTPVVPEQPQSPATPQK